ncbi:hypothetical protein QAD02_003039 [Eretmocerus hayati]|uniref:Uncharacterized protein n=1 Tax=Eretmocerus hayati TaxID=131215 RepID=A0ACC2NKT2_9HYME|nr:hypothetical protein QAD02_003039 [Eretmocerus hayati]
MDTETDKDDSLFIHNLMDDNDATDWTSEEEDVSDNFLDKLDKVRQFGKDLAAILDHTVSREKTEALLSLLRPQGGQFQNLPHRESTLHKNAGVKVPIRECDPGEYVHYGLRKCLEEQIEIHGLRPGETLEFDVNIDGVRLDKEGQDNLWPILGRVVIEGCKTKPFSIGAYRGTGKPKLAKEFL